MSPHEADSTSEVRPARASDAFDFAAHIARHLAESGQAGNIHFAPVTVVSRDDVVRESERRWATALTQPGWGRVWILVVDPPLDTKPWESAPRVVGHVELRGSLVHSGLHRAEMSIGLEASYRGAGHGQRLAEVALRFARDIGRFAYLDLKVFSHNDRARRLYARLGFREVGRVDDAFRMADGTKVDDIMMVKRL